jgi:hypothetical protein
MNNYNAHLIYRQGLESVYRNQLNNMLIERYENLRIFEDAIRDNNINEEVRDLMYSKMRTNTQMIHQLKKEKNQRIRAYFIERVLMTGNGRNMHRPALNNILKFTGDHVEDSIMDPLVLETLTKNKKAMLTR